MLDKNLQNKTIFLSEDIVSSEIDDELILLNISKGNYLKLNKTARWIFENIQNGDSCGVIFQKICKHFSVDHNNNDIENQLKEFLIKAESLEILKINKKT